MRPAYWFAAVLVSGGICGSLSAQSAGSPPADTQSAISIPTPAEGSRDRKKYETPELAGSSPAIGSQLIDGRLPRPLLDFVSRSSNTYQRLSFFEGGLVTLHLEAGGAVIRKRVLIPEEAMQQYLDLIEPAHLSQSDILRGHPKNINDGGFIRLHAADGSFSEARFRSSSVLPIEIERFRTALNDFGRVLAEDREVSNPLVDYEPRIGDRLLATDQLLYEITSLSNGGELIELTCTSSPLRMYVEKKSLYNHFHANMGRKSEVR